ncbi:CAMP-dependent protein kinase regulatory subunit [Plakobranchus ocellatus]|uniref:cAMP-dependent protein kinase regulatory subunit n=1 Tax=Plakobranchus ocellatus TaxID=259542 RepID=A0AAV4C9E7_9GAST|nr:CAMP-dependent protein kinase regulatory subunit [Plakobranchus ocellatus]
MSLLYDKVVNIINKPPDKRLDAEIEQILPWFRKRSDLFNSLHADIVRDIVKNCRFEPITKNQVIIRQMDKGDRFYIILSGSVSIHINTTLTEEEFEDVLKTQLDEEAHCRKDKDRVLDRNKYGIYVGKIDAGKSFGELALINADCVRNATIISDEPTDLLSVDRDLYNRSLRAFQAQEFAERKDFVAGFGMFQNWIPRYKKMMAFSLKKKVLKFEDTIVKQGAPVDGIYFIIRGQVKIRVDPSQHSQQYSNLYPLGDIAELEKEKARQLLRKEMNLVSQRTSDRRSMYVRRAMPSTDGAVRKANLKPFELCLAGAIDVIGDLEVAMGLSSYSQTVVCMEESTIYHLDQRNYDRLIEKRNPAALELLRDIVHTKLTLHFSRLPEDSIPLYRFFLYQLDEKEKDARRTAMAPRSKTSLGHGEANIDNLQKGPLVNMYGPGSVFYLIRKRAKEMEARRKRRNIIPAANFRTGISHKASPVTMALAATRGIIDTATAAAVYNNNHAATNQAHERGRGVSHEHEDYPDHGPPSTTESMMNLYGPPPHETGSDQGLDEADFINGGGGAGWGEDYDDEFEEGYDWASSDLALSQLEARMSQWHDSLGTTIKGTCVVPLHRYQVEDENRPKPGNKVYVKLRSKPKNVSFFAFQNTHDEFSSSDEAAPKPSVQGSRSPISSMRQLEIITDTEKGNEAMSEVADRYPLESRSSQRPRSTKSEPLVHEPHKQRKRKQYTKEEYLALKAELRRRQKAWISMLSGRSYTIM